MTTQWFFDSIEKGFCQDESIYKAEPRLEARTLPDTSTPTGQISTNDSKSIKIKINESIFHLLRMDLLG